MKSTTAAALPPRSCCWPRVPARAALNVVATTQDLAAIAQEVGGDRIKVSAIAKGYQDPHFVEAKPSFILTLNRADLLIVVGRELEVGVAAGARSPRAATAAIQPGRRRLSRSVDRAPGFWKFRPGRSRGRWVTSIALGNPHYWLDPENGRRIAKAIKDRLSQMDARQCRLSTRSARPISAGVSPRPNSAGKRRWPRTKGLKVDHLPSVVGELRRRIRPRCCRLRRAEAGHPADAAAHARRHQRDEGAEREADPGRAVFRSQDTQLDRARRPAAGSSSCRRRSAACRRRRTTSSCSTRTSRCC